MYIKIYGQPCNGPALAGVIFLEFLLFDRFFFFFLSLRVTYGVQLESEPDQSPSLGLAKFEADRLSLEIRIPIQ